MATTATEPAQEKATPTRRVRIFLVRPTDFLMLFTKGVTFAKRTKLLKGVPDDAELVGITYDTRMDFIMMVVKSMEFEQTPIDVYPPMDYIEFEIGIENTVRKKKK